MPFTQRVQSCLIQHLGYCSITTVLFHCICISLAPLFFFNLFVFNRRIIALRYCVGFCQTWTRICHRCKLPCFYRWLYATPQSLFESVSVVCFVLCTVLFSLTAWVGGFIAISVISFLSLLGVILVPLMNRVFFKFLLSFLVALAVGTLSGDAFLHLLPHVSK